MLFFVFWGISISKIHSVVYAKIPPSGEFRPEPAPVKSSRKSANEFGVKGYPLAPTIDGKLAFCQWCNGV